AGPSFERPASERRLDDMPFVGLGDRGKREDVPAFSSQDVADEIVFVQPLHDDDDFALGFVVQAGIERSVEPFVGGDAAALRHASPGFRGSSMMTKSAPRPVSTPPTEVASRKPPAVVMIPATTDGSGTA